MPLASFSLINVSGFTWNIDEPSADHPDFEAQCMARLDGLICIMHTPLPAQISSRICEIYFRGWMERLLSRPKLPLNLGEYQGRKL